METESDYSYDSNDEIEEKVYIPTGEETEDLVFDKTSYVYYQENPLSLTLVTGTQTEGNIVISNIFGLYPLENEDAETSVKCSSFKQNGGVNRIRFSNLSGQPLISSWSDTGKIFIWNINDHLNILGDSKSDNKLQSNSINPPLSIFSAHKCEGFSLDWSKTVSQRLSSGDNSGNIFVYNVEHPESYVNLSVNNSSVEDLQWSPSENDVLASCSCDGYIRIWDCRTFNKKSIAHVCASTSDVNVISWSKYDPFILSGDDLGYLKVWDIRQFGKTIPQPSAVFKYHKEPITSVEWHPTDSTTFCASSQDNQVSLWDVSAEAEIENDSIPDIPPQLLFMHLGQKEVKEVHWNAEHPGLLVSVSIDGFNIFKTINV